MLQLHDFHRNTKSKLLSSTEKSNIMWFALAPNIFLSSSGLGYIQSLQVISHWCKCEYESYIRFGLTRSGSRYCNQILFQSRQNRNVTNYGIVLRWDGITSPYYLSRTTLPTYSKLQSTQPYESFGINSHELWHQLRHLLHNNLTSRYGAVCINRGYLPRIYLLFTV